jgi:hypothetical protein
VRAQQSRGHLGAGEARHRRLDRSLRDEKGNVAIGATWLRYFVSWEPRPFLGAAAASERGTGAHYWSDARCRCCDAVIKDRLDRGHEYEYAEPLGRLKAGLGDSFLVRVPYFL